MNAIINVLDHGYVRLVDCMGNDLSIVRAARVSYAADWRAGDGSDEKLLTYLINNHHTSPFESVTMTFEIKCPIFIARQWHRHRTWSYNEISARYTELSEEFYVPDHHVIGTQSEKNKQQRIISERGPHGSLEIMEAASSAQLIDDACSASFEAYHKLLERGVPRELARSVLPVATYTRFFGTVNLHNLLRFIDLRLHEHAQWEAQQYAKALANLAKLVVPITHRILNLDARVADLS